jgi:hypothetical protein
VLPALIVVAKPARSTQTAKIVFFILMKILNIKDKRELSLNNNRSPLLYDFL